MHKGLFLIHVVCLWWVGREPSSPDLLRNLGWWSQTTRVVGHCARGKDSPGRSRTGNSMAWLASDMGYFCSQLKHLITWPHSTTKGQKCKQSYHVRGRWRARNYWWWPCFAIITLFEVGRANIMVQILQKRTIVHTERTVNYMDGKKTRIFLPIRNILRTWHKNLNFWHPLISQRHFLLFLPQTTTLFKPTCYPLLAYFFNQTLVKFFLVEFLKSREM